MADNERRADQLTRAILGSTIRYWIVCAIFSAWAILTGMDTGNAWIAGAASAAVGQYTSSIVWSISGASRTRHSATQILAGGIVVFCWSYLFAILAKTSGLTEYFSILPDAGLRFAISMTLLYLAFAAFFYAGNMFLRERIT